MARMPSATSRERSRSRWAPMAMVRFAWPWPTTAAAWTSRPGRRRRSAARPTPPELRSVLGGAAAPDGLGAEIVAHPLLTARLAPLLLPRAIGGHDLVALHFL